MLLLLVIVELVVAGMPLRTWPLNDRGMCAGQLRLAAARDSQGSNAGVVRPRARGDETSSLLLAGRHAFDRYTLEMQVVINCRHCSCRSQARGQGWGGWGC